MAEEESVDTEGPPPEEVMNLEDDMFSPEEEDSPGEEEPPDPAEVTSAG